MFSLDTKNNSEVMDLLNSLTVVTISKHHMEHHKYNWCQLCFSEVGERKWLTKDDDAWNSLWIFVVFTEMLAVWTCCNHAITPHFLKYCSKKSSGLEWGKAGLSLGPGQPLLLPREYLIGHSDPSPVALRCVVCVCSMNGFENPYDPPATLHPGPPLPTLQPHPLP